MQLPVAAGSNALCSAIFTISVSNFREESEGPLVRISKSSAANSAHTIYEVADSNVAVFAARIPIG